MRPLHILYLESDQLFRCHFHSKSANFVVCLKAHPVIRTHPSLVHRHGNRIPEPRTIQSLDVERYGITEPVPSLIRQSGEPLPSRPIMQRRHTEILLDLILNLRNHLVPLYLQLSQNHIPLILVHNPISYIIDRQKLSVRRTVIPLVRIYPRRQLLRMDPIDNHILMIFRVMLGCGK